MNYSVKNSGHPTTTFSGGMYGSGFSYGNDMMTRNENTSFNGNIDYQRFLNRDRTSNITLSYLFTTDPTTTESRNIYDPLPAGIPLTLNDLHSNSKMRGTEHTFQADYTTPLSKNQTLNAGAKFIGRRNTSDSKFYNIINGKEVFDSNSSVNYKNTQSILASYIEYKLTLGKFSAKAGARYEHTWENCPSCWRRLKNPKPTRCWTLPWSSRPRYWPGNTPSLARPLRRARPPAIS